MLCQRATGRLHSSGVSGDISLTDDSLGLDEYNSHCPSVDSWPPQYPLWLNGSMSLMNFKKYFF